MAARTIERWVTNAIRFHVQKQRDRFLRATRDCAGQQQKVLRRLLTLNANTRFAADHGLTPRTTFSHFRARVPISDYDYHQPYIDAVKSGDHTALLGRRNRLLMFSLTSGTTSESKFIPVTSRFLADYRRGWQHWGITALKDHPDLLDRRFFQLCGDHEQFHTEGGTPCGNISGLVAAMQRPQVRRMYSIPGSVHTISDSTVRRYVSLRIAVADGDIGQIVTANPSTLLQLGQFAHAQADELVRDIRDGGISEQFRPDAQTLQALSPHLEPNPKRAAEVDVAMNARGELRLGDVWEHLAFLGVWTGGSAGSFIRSLPRWYGEVPCRDHGLHASEGRMTIPLADETSSGVLDVTTHVFEFIPEAEGDARNPTVLQPHELEVGQNYFILLTTSSGLHRYNIRDVVQCTGFCHSTPELAFLHKGAHISSITGEKISESQVVTAAGRASERQDVPLRIFTLTPAWDRLPHYRLYVDERDAGCHRIRERLAAEIDSCLSEENSEYRDKRESGRLGTVQCDAVGPAAFAQLTRHRVESRPGASLEQYKHPCLLPDPGFESLFLKQSGLERRAASA